MMNTRMCQHVVSAMTATLSLLLFGASGSANADTSSPPPSTNAPGMVEGNSAPIPPDADAAVYQDTHSDGVWAAPTALTPPKGSVSLQMQEVLVLSASYSVTDRVQVRAIAAPLPAVNVAAVALKARLFEAGRWRLALQGSAMHFREYGNAEGNDRGNITNAGLIATLCLDEECHSLLNGYAGGFVKRSDQEEIVAAVSAGALIRLTKHVKVMAELDTGKDRWNTSEPDDMLLWYGARITGSRLALDAGFVRPVLEDWSGDLPAGVPWFKLTWRMR